MCNSHEQPYIYIYSISKIPRTAAARPYCDGLRRPTDVCAKEQGLPQASPLCAWHRNSESRSSSSLCSIIGHLRFTKHELPSITSKLYFQSKAPKQYMSSSPKSQSLNKLKSAVLYSCSQCALVFGAFDGWADWAEKHIKAFPVHYGLWKFVEQCAFTMDTPYWWVFHI